MRWLFSFTALLVAAAPAESQVARAYEYDALGRVTRVTPSSGNTVCYRYDQADNRINVSTVCSPGSPPHAADDYMIEYAPSGGPNWYYVDVLSNDSDADLPADALTVVGVSGNSFAVISGGQVWLENAYSGHYEFDYTVQDSSALQDTGHVVVDIYACQWEC